jgi:hypothetical protein
MYRGLPLNKTSNKHRSSFRVDNLTHIMYISTRLNIIYIGIDPETNNLSSTGYVHIHRVRHDRVKFQG